MNKVAEKIKGILELGGIKKDIIFLVISGVSLLISILNLIPLPFDIVWVAIIVCGIPIILEAMIGLITEFDIKADVLVSLALIASIGIGEYFAAGEVAFIMQLGALLEDLTVAKARAGIEKLIRLTPQTARVVMETGEKEISAQQVRVDDILRVLPGELVPVDGVIISGQTSVNQAVMTGESMPVDKTVDDEVASGTLNQYGVFEMRATKVGEDSSIQRMIRLVQSADAGKAKIVGLADRWATWIVVLALAFAVLTWFLTGEIIRSVTVLVVFCPCALVLATPTAIIAAIGNATKHGFLVREGDALERLALVTKVTFDKTGTLTYGLPKVIRVKSHSEHYEEDDLYHMVASAEQFSEHPLGKAITECYRNDKKQSLKRADDVQIIPGQGVMAKIEGAVIFAGNEKFFQEREVLIPSNNLEESGQYLQKGCTVVYLAINHKYSGYLVLSDTVRKESRLMLSQLTSLGVQPVLVTGDHENAASFIADELGVDKVYANCLPEDKLHYIDSYQKRNEKVCMIGDGINDAPALKKADVGIAMGGIGSDIAIDAADITLIDDEIKELPHLFALSKRMMVTIKCNLTLSMGLNFLAVLLAMAGLLHPVAGALVHNAGSVVVITNSALLLKWSSRKS